MRDANEREHASYSASVSALLYCDTVPDTVYSTKQAHLPKLMVTDRPELTRTLTVHSFHLFEPTKPKPFKLRLTDRATYTGSTARSSSDQAESRGPPLFSRPFLDGVTGKIQPFSISWILRRFSPTKPSRISAGTGPSSSPRPNH